MKGTTCNAIYGATYHATLCATYGATCPAIYHATFSAFERTIVRTNAHAAIATNDAIEEVFQ